MTVKSWPLQPAALNLWRRRTHSDAWKYRVPVTLLQTDITTKTQIQQVQDMDCIQSISTPDLGLCNRTQEDLFFF